ncbi:hypothetical protein PPL_02495 [Heterostelium album PN500]|uniref:Uncharacterized protein n=1 Tax=Heterostelium pallidum (strain ATCC 26659 / Pp 5 / PN500) TaxID=670386 RepID=D3B287_HETP5|nr:hypothetical protein PPL_02495 [Heterostelium album PN500]EFA84462.1 hypothetical protein PPL_02495 [Heterostelium album PN500]|eukprot:XP_020436576.1 hypothetical protein PPL_02495 [Heterostelium album PN500]
MSGRFLTDSYSYKTLIKQFDFYLCRVGSSLRAINIIPHENSVYYVNFFHFLLFDSVELVQVIRECGYLFIDECQKVKEDHLTAKQILNITYMVAIDIFKLIPPRTKDDFIHMFISNTELNTFSILYLKKFSKITMRLKSFHMCLTRDDLDQFQVEQLDLRFNNKNKQLSFDDLSD